MSASKRRTAQPMSLRLRVAIWVGGVCGLAALVAQGGRFSDFLDLFTHFAPLYLAGSILVVGLALLRRSLRRLLVLGVAATLSSLLLMAAEFPRSRQATASTRSERLKIAQFNLSSDDQWNSSVVAWLAEADPDVVVLEDLGPNLRRAISQRLPGRHFVCTDHCGVALISKARPTSSKTYRGEHYGLTPPAALARFGGDRNGFLVVGTHLARPYAVGPDSMSTYTGVRTENMRRLRRIMKAYPQSGMILVGDFNSTPWSFTFQRDEAQLGLERRTRLLFTWPANLTGIALLPIDHVYAGADWRTVSVNRGPRLGSDHYPVVVVLERSRVD